MAGSAVFFFENPWTPGGPTSSGLIVGENTRVKKFKKEFKKKKLVRRGGNGGRRELPKKPPNSEPPNSMVSKAHSPPPKNIGQVIYEYVDRKNSTIFFKLPTCYSLNSLNQQPTSKNTVDKLNKSKSSGLVNIFTLVLPLVRWWCCCCCLFLQKLMTVSLITMVAVVAMAARGQRQHWQWRWWTTIGGERYGANQCEAKTLKTSHFKSFLR